MNPIEVTVSFDTAAPRPACAVCGTPAEKHGSYPTCASHPYTATFECAAVGIFAHGKFIGQPCPGAECMNGCARAATVSPIQPAVGGADPLKTALAALELAHTFIRDGVEFGYIKDTTKPDWRGALRETSAAIDALASTSPAQTGGHLRELLEAKPRHDDGSPAPENTIAKAKRILNAVDDYHDSPTMATRSDLRHVIHAQLKRAEATGGVDQAWVERIRAEERERCATVCEDLAEDWEFVGLGHTDKYTAASEAMNDCAKAIRASTALGAKGK